jgi:hypothetical protein
LELESHRCGRRHPLLKFIGLRECDRHGFGMNDSDFCVRFCGEEGKQIIGGLAFLDLANRLPLRHPDSGKEHERMAFEEIELYFADAPHDQLASVRHFACNLVRAVADKRSLKNRRKRAGWDTEYLTAILGAPPC